jgi:hypothetical protein
MKVLLVSSNPEAQVPNKGYDLYVHFNSSKHFHKTPAKKSIVTVRQRPHIVNPDIVCHAACELNCYKNLGHCEHDCFVKTYPQDVFIAGWKENLHHYSDTKRIYLDFIEYPPDSEPTTGWAAINYFINKGNEVTVCGFDLKVAPYRRSKIHNINYEINELKELVNEEAINSI